MAPPRNRRPGFSRRAQYGLFAGYVAMAAGAVVAVALLVVAAISPSAFAGLRMGAAELTVPVSTGLDAVRRGAAAVPNAIGSYFAVHSENARLRRELEIEHRIVRKSQAISYDTMRLKRLLDLRERATDTIVTARLVSSTAASTRRFAILNAGFRQGVREGQPVRGPNGLIGRVLEVGPDAARVMLLTDSESVVPVRRVRDGVPLIASGRGDRLIEVRPISLSDTPSKAGDVLVTSGTGGIYPPNIPVARITGRNGDGGLAMSFERPDALDYAIVQRAFFKTPALPSEPE